MTDPPFVLLFDHNRHYATKRINNQRNNSSNKDQNNHYDQIIKHKMIIILY